MNSAALCPKMEVSTRKSHLHEGDDSIEKQRRSAQGKKISRELIDSVVNAIHWIQ
jgi:hypothetical protein